MNNISKPDFTENILNLKKEDSNLLSIVMIGNCQSTALDQNTNNLWVDKNVAEQCNCVISTIWYLCSMSNNCLVDSDI